MYLIIYFNNKPLFLCDDLDMTLQPYLHHDDSVFIDELDSHAVKAMIHEMQQEKIHAGIYYHKNLDELKEAFFKKFTLILAAGGFVQNEKKEVLLIFRRGKWDLPKGKCEKKETPESCAVRETEEETGLINVQIVSKLPVTYHTYHEGSRHILKETHWYKMKCSGKQHLVPQESEDISKIIWVSEKEISRYYTDSYPAVTEILNAGFADQH